MKNGHYYIQYIPKEALEEFKELTEEEHKETGGLESYLNENFINFDLFVSGGFLWSKSKFGMNYWLYLKPVKITVIPEQPNYTPCPCGVSC